MRKAMNDFLELTEDRKNRWYGSFRRDGKNGIWLFLMQSHSRAAIEELQEYVLGHPQKGLMESIEEFRQMIDDFACESTSEATNRMFSTYYDVVTDILDLVIARGGDP